MGLVTGRVLLGVWVVLVGGTAIAAPGPEIPLPEFDHENVAASFVVSLPSSYDGGKKWPLIIDLHGAIAPSRRGAVVTRAAVWAKFVEQVPVIVAAPNGRTRAWGTIKGKRDDRAYVARVLAEMKKRYSIDGKRIYLAGFSSGSDFLCKGGLQLSGDYAGSLVVCPGPSHVLGLRGGEILKARKVPFYFVAGEEDYVRKSGAWEAMGALIRSGGRAHYREVPGKGHVFPGLDEYAEAFRQLEILAGNAKRGDGLSEARAARARGDLRLASMLLAGLAGNPAEALRKEIEAEGERRIEEAAALDAEKEPGRAYEAWWFVYTRLGGYMNLWKRAEKELQALEEKHQVRDLYRARRDYFRRRATRAPPEKGREEGGRLWRFDRYLDARETAAATADLARRFPGRCRLRRIGESVEGRGLLLLEITDLSTGPPDSKPAVWLQGGIHGNETSAVMTVLYAAWQLAANPERSRGTDRLLRDTTIYALPVLNPDGLDLFMNEPQPRHGGRHNLRPFDSDRDGAADEDGWSDLDGDGEVGILFVPDAKGTHVLREGRLVRGEGGSRYRMLCREGVDRDGDGRIAEDRAGGTDLNRNFPVGFRSRARFGGTSGPSALSEPESRAVAEFVRAHPNIALFLDVHSDANCFYYWTGPEECPDEPLYGEMAGRVRTALGYGPRPLRHPGAGLAIAFAYGELGIPAAIVELESVRGDRDAYREAAWNGAAFLPPRPFDHPQLGRVLIGNDLRKATRNIHPRDIFWQADRNFAWLKKEAGRLPRLELVDPVIAPSAEGYIVTGAVRNAGEAPLDTGRARVLGTALPVVVEAKGARLVHEENIGSPPPGGEATFAATLTDCAETVDLVVRHPRGGRVELAVARPRSPTVPIRRDYRIEPGFATPETARAVTNGHFEDGVPKVERGPAFSVPLGKDELRVGVVLGEWKDRRHAVPPESFAAAFFGEGENLERSMTGQHVYGSVRDFYDEMSYGRLKVTGRVFPWVELPGGWKEYRDASFGSPMLHDRMMKAVLERDGADALDGFDGLAFIWAGNAVRRTSMLWPMRLKLRARPGVVAFKMSEIYKGEAAPIGVACHEMAHTFGVNDKYGLGASGNPLGPYCLIGKGTHGGGASARHRPFHLCAWCKSVIGWVKPTAIDPATPQDLALRPILSGSREAFRVLLRPDGSEYLLLTNRRREGFFTDLPSPGLVVLKVGPNDKPSAPQARVELLPAHGLPPAARSDPARPEAIAWPQPEKTELVVSGVRISNIRLVDDVVYFRVGPAGR